MPQSKTYTENDIIAILGVGRSPVYTFANSELFKTIRNLQHDPHFQKVL